MYSVGDKIIINRRDIVGLISRHGIITHIDGSYVMIEINNGEREIELYTNEIKFMGNVSIGERGRGYSQTEAD